MARSIPASNRDWDIAGFLDDRKNILDSYDGEGPILGDVETYNIQSIDRFVCAIGYTEPRLRYASALEARGAIFTNIIHPGAFIGDRTKIGTGCIVWPFVVITTDITIGDHVSIMPQTVIGHNARIGDGSILSSFSFVGGHAEIGRGAFLAPHASVVPKKKVGDFATIGIGSVSLRDVPPKNTVFGLPATQIS